MSNVNAYVTVEKLDKLFAKCREEAKVDCKFNTVKIINEFTITERIIKWIDRKTEWENVYRLLERERVMAERKAIEFYATDFNMTLSNKSERAVFVDSDTKYSEIKFKADTVKGIIKYCEDIIDSLKNLRWEMQTYVKFHMFQQGVDN